MNILNVCANDYLKIDNDLDIRKIIKEETLLFSDKVNKINKLGFNQERSLVITNKAVYNLKKKILKRRLEIIALKGITISKLTEEFILHGIDIEYDYYFTSSKRKLIVKCIADAYYNIKNQDILFCIMNEKSIKKYVTSKDEKKKNLYACKMPINNFVNIKSYISDNKQFINNQQTSNNNNQINKNVINTTCIKISNMIINDFKKLKVIGLSSFSSVYLVECIIDKEIYVMKSVYKDVLVDKDLVESTLLEKRILEEIESPFIINYKGLFQEQFTINIILPFVKGGDLFNLLTNLKTLNEELVKFYMAQVGLAIQSLHNHNIINRDIKPENILIKDNGYIILCDFGLSKLLKENERAYSICGTPEYISPEIILGNGHGKSTDWWSYGIMLYELLYGIPPFYNKNIDIMYDVIVNGDIKLNRNNICISSEAKDLISKLLNRDPEKRLGYKSGFNEIKSHPFFKSIDFKSLLELKPSLIPNITNNKIETKNFEKEFTKLNPNFMINLPNYNIVTLNNNLDKFKSF